MNFNTPLLQGTLIKRYKRFMADIQLDSGDEITAHCPNSGAMWGVKDPGLRVWVSEATNPNRKLKYTWEMVEVDGALIGVNTSHPNALVEEGIQSGVITELQGYATLKREVKYGVNSRIDILLDDPSKGKCYVEVKNVHMMRTPGLVEFPDSVTERGAKHMGELAQMVKDGHRAVIVYLVQRSDGTTFKTASDIDPKYHEACVAAFATGVEPLVYDCHMTPQGITAKGALSRI